ncbi:hypothetical protein CYMTET_47738 [Cymbomonas tetramitiformis]|uniref:Uncharacterized protein n=1 Tax=Cymbomonas tetramitiformis TaxID=36881 RepID=A0AAE0BV07_9CHLO|nr:hypothetical protein CYMTET_47738 [Cymbomonas tetramitiformis]
MSSLVRLFDEVDGIFDDGTVGWPDRDGEFHTQEHLFFINSFEETLKPFSGHAFDRKAGRATPCVDRIYTGHGRYTPGAARPADNRVTRSMVADATFIESLLALVLPKSRESFYSEGVPNIAKALAEQRGDGESRKEWFHFFAGIYDAFLRVSHDLSQHLNWKLEERHWFAGNALEVYRHLRWINFKASGSADIDDSLFEAGLRTYLAETKSLALSPGNHYSEFDRMFCVALAERATSACSSKDLSEHVSHGTGLDLSQLGSVVSSCAQRGPTMSSLWWIKTTNDSHSEIHRSRWMHRITHFVMEEYTALMDQACHHFGVAMTIALTEDRASWWKVCREDAELCSEYVGRMPPEERFVREARFLDGPYPNLAYHVPVRVARRGLYRDSAERERELLTLFESMASYLRRGERVTLWLCEKADQILAELRNRMYIGKDLQAMSFDDVREIHDGVVGGVTGVAAIRACTLHTCEARHACLHTRSEAFAGLVQMVSVMRQRWDPEDGRLRSVEGRLLEYVDELCAASKAARKDSLCRGTSTPRQGVSHRPRRVQLDSFLENIAGTDLSSWTENVLGIERMPSANEERRAEAFHQEDTDCDFLDVLLQCGNHPLACDRVSDLSLHGTYHENDTSKPVVALSPVGVLKADATRVRISRWTLELRDVYPFRVPVKEDRLCRRRYRAIPLRLSSADRTQVFLDTYVRSKCAPAARHEGLQGLCRQEAPPSDLFARIMCQRFDAEVACMHRERSALLATDDTFSSVRSGFVELVFWLREYVDCQRRWVHPDRLCRERLPQAWQSRATTESDAWADVFVIFPDEFRIAFKHSEKSMSNCVGIKRQEAQASARFLRFVLRPGNPKMGTLVQSLRSALNGEWYMCQHAGGEVIVRVEERERHAAEIAIGFEHIDEYGTEPCVCDVREAVFVPGAMFSVASMGRFVQFLFWGLFQAMATETDRPWSGLVPSKPLSRLPCRESARGHPKLDTDRQELCVADSCWREYVMWVTVELQRVALSMRANGMSPRISGAGLAVMASQKIYAGETIASALRSLNECRTERTKRVVRPNSYLNTRSVLLLDNIGCTYFPFDSHDVMDKCSASVGFVKTPGYDSKKHPYLHKVFVDVKGDLREDVPMCFASPIITPVAFSETTLIRHGRAGYLPLNHDDAKRLTLQADIRCMRIANLCDHPKCPPLMATGLNRRDRGDKEDEATRSVIDRIELIAHKAAIEQETSPVCARTSSDDAHSSHSVGVSGAHLSRRRGAQFGTRFLFRDSPTDKGETPYRLCLEDFHRRVSLGFCELGTDFWSDVKRECLHHDEPRMIPDADFDLAGWERALRRPGESVLRPLRHLLVPRGCASAMETILRPFGWAPSGSLASGVYVFRPCDVSQTSAQFAHLPPKLHSRIQDKLRSLVETSELVSNDAPIDRAVATLMLRYQISDASAFVRQVCATPDVGRLREELSTRMVFECRQIGERLQKDLRDSLPRTAGGEDIVEHASLIEAIACAILAGCEQAEALPLAPRVIFRWLELTGNACLIRKCTTKESNLRDECVTVQTVLRCSRTVIHSARHRKPCALADRGSHLWPSAQQLKLSSLSPTTTEWAQHAKLCAAYISAFFPHEDLLHGAPEPESPTESSSVEQPVRSKQALQRSRCNRHQLQGIMQKHNSASGAPFDPPELRGVDARFVWLNVLTDCLSFSDPEEEATSERENVLETSKDEEMTDSDPHRAGKTDIGINDICHDNVRRTLLLVDDCDTRSSVRRPRYTLDACIKFVGEAGSPWIQSLEAVSRPVGKSFHGLFDMMRVQFPDVMQRGLERRAAARQDAHDTRLLIELAMRDATGAAVSTRAKPFRFSVDALLSRHAFLHSSSDQTERVWFPTAMRCDLVTNERRVIREKEGAAGILTCNRGRVESFTFMISTPNLTQDASVAAYG